MRRAPLLAAALGWALLALPREAGAAPKKQCIAAAESAQQLRSSGHLIEARKALAACTATTCPAVVRRDCGRWLEEIDAAQPSVTVKLEDSAGAETTEGRVLLDGAPTLQAADGRTTLLDPGVHKFVWTPRESGNVEQEVVIREGERNRVIVLRAVAAMPLHIEPPLPPPPVRAHSPLPYVVGGLGIALAGAGGVLWGLGLNERAGLTTSCAAAHTCAQNDIDASRTKLIVGDVLVGVGVVAVAAAIFLFLNRSSTSSSTATANRAGLHGVLSEFSASRPFVMRAPSSTERLFYP